MENRTLHVGSVDYAAGQKKTLDLDRSGVVMSYNLRVQFTVTSGSSGPATPLFQTLARLIRRAEINIQGRDTVVSHSGEMLAARAQYEFGTKADGMDDTVVLSGSSTATSYDVTIPIPRFLPRSQQPTRTGDDLRKTSQARMEITFGDIDDLFGTANGASISNVTVDVEEELLHGLPEDSSFLIRQLSEITDEIGSTTDNNAFTIDGRTGLEIRTLALAYTDDDVGANDVLNKLWVQSSSFVWHSRKAGAVRAQNKAFFGQEALIDGFYYQPFTFAGSLQQMIGTKGLPADLKAIQDVTVGSGTTRYKASIEAVRPLKTA